MGKYDLEQTYKIDKINSFNVTNIFECGQCFRWNKQPDNSYTGVFKQNVLNVKQNEKGIIFKGLLNEDIKLACEKYFDLNRNYEKIKEELSNKDEYLKASIKYGQGIRILNQDFWETIISFIISANNNIPRIKGIIERISEKYGSQLTWKNKKYYTFPTPEQLGKASIEDLRSLGLGFRDKRVYDVTKSVLQGEINLEHLKHEEDINILKEKLLTMQGVGPKVADCIMLFSLNKFEVFPIDVWVRRVMNELYIKKQDENKIDKKEIEKLAKEKYGNLAGIAQQYLFYWKRETA